MGATAGYDGGMDLKDKNALVVLGPTASGKTHLGVQLARSLGGEIVSADSRQVYRGLNLSAGKDLGEYVVDGTAIPYHLIDIVDLDVEFSVFDYQHRFYSVFEDLERRQVLPVIVGGTGLYLEAVLMNYRMTPVPENPALRAELETMSEAELARRLVAAKPRLHNTTDLENRERIVRAIEIAEYSCDHAPEPAPEVRALLLGMLWERDALRARIRARLQERIKTGMIDEIKCLHEQGVSWERLDRLGLEFRFIAAYLEGTIKTRSEMFEKLYIAICQFAKRQMTWFRRMERQGISIHWMPQNEKH